MNKLPFEVTRLTERMKTHGGNFNQLEPHCLKSLATRLLLSKQEALAHIAAGRLLPVSGPLNGHFNFPAAHLDALRNGVVAFIAETICTELACRGADEDFMLRACARAYEKQIELARSRSETAIELARGDDDDSFVGGAKRGAGLVAGAGAAAGAGYLGYHALRNRRNANGTPLLPGSGGPTLDDDFNLTPKSPNGSGGATGLPAAPTVTTAADDAADHDLLSTAIKTGQRAVASIGGAIRSAVKFIPR